MVFAVQHVAGVECVEGLVDEGDEIRLLSVLVTKDVKHRLATRHAPTKELRSQVHPLAVLVPHLSTDNATVITIIAT